MAYFNLTGQTRKIDVRAALDQYLQSDVPKPITISSDLADVFFPLRFLPVVAQDQNTNDGIVMVKGTIVSIIGQIEVNGSPSFRFPLPSDTSLSNTGTSVLPIAPDMVTGNTLTVSSLNSYWGYADDHIGVIVPANGGTNTAYSYSATDVTLGTYLYNGTLAAAGNTITIPANRPLGVTMTTIMQDARGRHLSYYNPANKAYGIQTTGYLSMPFVNWAKMIDDGVVSNAFTASTAYAAVRSLFPFAYMNNTGTYSNGMWVNSDAYGRFVISTDETPSIQTVGKFVAADFRLPKTLSQYIDNHPGADVKGTNTGGLDKTLFAFIVLVLTAVNGSAPTIAEVTTAVNSGYFGYARILLMLS